MRDDIPIHNFSETNSFVCVDTICKANEHMFYPAHRHQFYELLFFSAGKGSHLIDFSEHPIDTNMIYFLSPGQIHQMKYEGYKGYSIAISQEIFHHIQSIENLSFSPLFYPLDNDPFIKIDNEHISVFNKLFTLLKEENSKVKININLVRNYVSAILINCLEYASISKRSNLNDRIKTLRSEINNSFKKEKRGSYYAQKLCLSLRHLNEIANKTLGKTITQLIHERIILEAKREIVYTDKTIKEIAYELGFKDPAYFNRFFKKIMGNTPEEFRKTSN